MKIEYLIDTNPNPYHPKRNRISPHMPQDFPVYPCISPFKGTPKRSDFQMNADMCSHFGVWGLRSRIHLWVLAVGRASSAIFKGLGDNVGMMIGSDVVLRRGSGLHFAK